MPGPSTGSPLVLSYKGLAPDRELLDWARAGWLGGIVLFKDNCFEESALKGAVSQLRNASPHVLYVMIDEEGGRVRRLPDSAESMPDLRSYEGRSAADVAFDYTRMATRLQGLGIDTLLAPVVDIGDPSSEWLHSRTFSDSPNDVARMARAVIEALRPSGVRSCAKHFPGTGRVTLDPHLSPVISEIGYQEWHAHEASPFRAAIDAGVPMVLVGHQIMRGFGEILPACLSHRIVADFLRGQLRYRGLVLTDDLAMGATSRSFPIEESLRLALEATCDLILICNDRELQRRAVAAWQTRAEAESHSNV